MSDYNDDLYQEMLLDNGIQYDNDEVTEELLEHFWDDWDDMKIDEGK